MFKVNAQQSQDDCKPHISVPMFLDYRLGRNRFINVLKVDLTTSIYIH